MINIKGDYQIGYKEFVQVVHANSENPICNFYERGFIRDLTTGKQDWLATEEVKLIFKTIKEYNRCELQRNGVQKIDDKIKQDKIQENLDFINEHIEEFKEFVKQKQVERVTKDILSDYNNDINLIQQQVKMYKDAQDKLFGEEI